jgi:protein-L-isoaspartate(D-aspartate) O-methyltransferase
MQTPARLARQVRATPGVRPEVAGAMIATPRHRFVHWRYVLRAYDDVSLPTGPNTTISQPTYVARVLSAGQVTASDRVLEIGCGSGWTAAILAQLAHEVVTVDRVGALIERARARLADVPNVRVVHGDGIHAADGTFDAIFVMCGAPAVPPSYTERLRDGGRLVIPVGRRNEHAMQGEVVRVTRRGSELVEEPLFAGEWNVLGGRDGFS